MKNDKISLILRLLSSFFCLTSLIILAFPLVGLREGCGPDSSSCVIIYYSAFNLSKIGAAGIESFWIPYYLIVCLIFLFIGSFLISLRWKIVGSVAAVLLLVPAFILLIESDHLCLQEVSAVFVSVFLMLAFVSYSAALVFEIVWRRVSRPSSREK
ncbi:MAG: hypothetical protein WCS90_02295 [Bacilli bacterium]